MELKAGIPILEKEPLEKVELGAREIDFIKEAVTKYEVELDLEQVILLLKYKETLIEYANRMLSELTGSETINDINFIEIRRKVIKPNAENLELSFNLLKIIGTVRTVEDILNFNQSEKINFKSLDIGIINSLIEEVILLSEEDETTIKESFLESITSELVSYFNDVRTVKENEEKPITDKKYPILYDILLSYEDLTVSEVSYFNDVRTVKENEEKPITDKKYPILYDILLRYEDLTVSEVVLSLLDELINSFKEEPVIIENMKQIKELFSVNAVEGIEVEF